MFKIIAKLGSIPDGASVLKIGGSKEYIVKRKLRIFAEATEQNHEIKCEVNCVFLVDGTGDVNMCSDSKEVCWLATDEDVRDMLDPVDDC